MEQQNSEDQGGGIFLSRGVSLRLSNIRLVLGPDGVTGPPVTFEVSLEMGPFWLEIAMSRLNEAQPHHVTVLNARNDKEPSTLGRALEGEFERTLAKRRVHATPRVGLPPAQIEALGL